jgi:phosphohistidine phosphatase SixA
MLLYLVRHGKAEMGDDDDARRLTPAGKDAVQRVAKRLAKSDVQIEIIEHSGLARAKETAEIIQQALGGRISAVPGLRPMDKVAGVGLQLLHGAAVRVSADGRCGGRLPSLSDRGNRLPLQ